MLLEDSLSPYMWGKLWGLNISDSCEGRINALMHKFLKDLSFSDSDTQSEAHDTLGNFLLHCFPPTFFCKARNMIPLLLIRFGSWSCGYCLVNYLVLSKIILWCQRLLCSLLKFVIMIWPWLSCQPRWFNST